MGTSAATVTAYQFVGRNVAPPTVTPANNVSAVLASNSTDAAGQVTISPSSNAPVGTIATVNFNQSLNVPPSVILTPTSGPAAFAVTNNNVFVTPTTTGFGIVTGSNVLPTATYSFNWTAMGKANATTSLTGTVSSSNNFIVGRGFIGANTQPPTVTTGGGVGTGTLVVDSNCCDAAGSITVTPGGTGPGGPQSVSTVANVAFRNGFSNTCAVALQPLNAAAAAQSGNIFVTPLASGFQLNVGGTALTPGTPYSWNWVTMGRNA